MRVVIGAVVGVLILLLSTPLLGALDLIGFSDELHVWEIDYPVGTNISHHRN